MTQRSRAIPAKMYAAAMEMREATIDAAAHQGIQRAWKRLEMRCFTDVISPFAGAFPEAGFCYLRERLRLRQPVRNIRRYRNLTSTRVRAGLAPPFGVTSRARY